MIVEDLKALATDIGRLSNLPDNPRKGNVDAVANSLATFGQRKPVIARKVDGVVIAGNHTLQAARQLGWTEIAVVWVEDDEITAKAYALADNRTADLGTYDDQLLADMILAVQQEDEQLLAMSGWDDQAVQDLLYIVQAGEQAPDVPNFQPTDDEQPRLDQREPTMCPQCSFQWRVGPGGEIQPV
jgi:ParB-like chromosome segregation protein Spo0J